MSHEAGKGDAMRPTNHEAFSSGMDRIDWSKKAKPAQEPCPDKERDEYTCKNRHQCWEPCGELGKSEQHAVVAQPEQKAAEFWQGVYPDGWTAKRVQAEMTDYQMILDGLSELIYHVTGGQCSKPNTDKAVIKSLFDDYVTETVENAVKEALAQPEQEHVAVPGGNWWTIFNSGGAVVGEHFTLDDVRDYMTPERFERGWNAVSCVNVTSQAQLDTITTPPQRKPLTDEQIFGLWSNDHDRVSFARAIEAAHGIKGQA